MKNIYQNNDSVNKLRNQINQESTKLFNKNQTSISKAEQQISQYEKSTQELNKEITIKRNEIKALKNDFRNTKSYIEQENGNLITLKERIKQKPCISKEQIQECLADVMKLCNESNIQVSAEVDNISKQLKIDIEFRALEVC